MIRWLRWLRLLSRATMVAVLAVTAVAAVGFAPTAPEVASDTMAPVRQTEPGAVAAVAERVAGGPGTVTLFDFEILDPVVALVGLIAAPSSATRILAGAAVPILLALLLGRVFCGYLCPVGWLATGLAWLRRKIAGSPARPVASSWPARVLLGGVVVGALAGLSSGVLLLLHVQVQRLAMAPLDRDTVFFALGALAAFLSVELLVAPGIWCRSLCPSGALYDLLAIRRRASVVNCGARPCPESCHRCDEVCWLHLTPRAGDAGTICDLCLSCAVVCPQKRLHPRRLGPTVALVLAWVAGPLGCAPDAAPELDNNPPWSTAINRLDGEAWQRAGAHQAGLSVAFLETRETGDLYLFAAALWDQPSPPGASFRLESPGGRAELEMDGPNSPRSTPTRATYAGRALVAHGACHRLSVSFGTLDAAASLEFPRRCRQRSVLSFAWGTAAILILLTLTTRIVRILSSSDRPSAVHRGGGPP